MINALLTGVGGQGTVLAAKILAQAAMSKGWKVRTAETIGMAQRGGSVVSHVRMGNKGETIHEPLLAQHSADLIIAFEPAEAVRVLPYLSPDGLLVSATTPVQAVSTALLEKGYHAEGILKYLENTVSRFTSVDDASICEEVGSRKVLNIVLLACALYSGNIGININDLCLAIDDCVKEQFREMNLAAVEVAVAAQRF